MPRNKNNPDRWAAGRGNLSPRTRDAFDLNVSQPVLRGDESDATGSEGGSPAGPQAGGGARVQTADACVEPERHGRPRESAQGSHTPRHGESPRDEQLRADLAHAEMRIRGVSSGPPDRLDTDRNQTGNRPDSRRETDWRVNLAADDLGGILDLHRGNLDEVVLDAVKRNERELALVGSGDPLATDRRYQSSAWRLASELRGHPLFADHESYEAVAKVDAVLAGHGGWDAVSQHDVMVCGHEVSHLESDPREDFISCWSEIKTPLSPAYHPEIALPPANEFPLSSDRWQADSDACYRLAISICYWFAQLLGNEGRFFMSCRMLAGLVGKPHTTAASYLRRAVAEGALELRRKGVRGRTSRYRFRFAVVAFADESPASVEHDGSGAVPQDQPVPATSVSVRGVA